MSQGRIILILVLIFIFGATIIGRLVFIQILNQDFYKALAIGQQNNFEIFVPQRGKIFFSDGKNLLATNYLSNFIFISPNKIKNKENTAIVLSQILNLKEDSLLEKLNKDSLYQELKTDLTEEELEKIKEANLPAVYISQKIKRYYPQESLASQIVGFLGGDGRGQYGIEGYYDDVLRGNEIRNGSDIILTLDFDTQFMAEKLLKEAKEELDIEGGQIIIIDPNTGKVIAMANFPNFNPNQYTEINNLEIFQNTAIQKIFEPGSIFKPITMAAAIEEKKVTPKTTFIDKGYEKIDGYTIYNYDKEVWGEKTMTEVLELSINTGAIFAERQIDHKVFLDYINKFGIFEPTNIDLQGEVFSQNKEFKNGYEINFATASFGQGIEMTPIQIVRGISIIANGGKLIKPYLVNPNPEEEKQIISQKTTAQLTAMLVSSVENGYAKRAKIPGYYIAGKTGTSQVPFSSLGIDKAGYSDKTWQSFIGWFPAFNPQFLILVKLDNPKAPVAGASTTLIARDLIKYLIDYHQIPPDYE